MTLDERDDEMCRKVGWPTITEQKAYWQQKTEIEEALVNTLRQAIFAMSQGDRVSLERAIILCEALLEKVEEQT